MPATLITFRAGLKTAISDVLADASMSCGETEEALVALTVALADVREEGTQLHPSVLVCDDRDTVLRVLQGSGPIQIGEGSKSPETALRALKKCAPLANESWAIWISREGEGFRYGVFREPAKPTSIDLRRTLFNVEADLELRALLIGQTAPGRVEIVRPGGSGLRIHLSGERDDQPIAEDAEEVVVAWWASDIEDSRSQETFTSYGVSLLHDLLRKGHGALIAVAPAGTDVQGLIGDGVVLHERIDMLALVDAHARDGSSSALSELLGYSDLLAGMLGSDGIVLLDSRGGLAAFNWFVRSENSDLSPREQQGGARHRAFGALRALVDEGHLVGVFIRSSDGGEAAYGGSGHD